MRFLDLFTNFWLGRFFRFYRHESIFFFRLAHQALRFGARCALCGAPLRAARFHRALRAARRADSNAVVGRFAGAAHGAGAARCDDAHRRWRGRGAKQKTGTTSSRMGQGAHRPGAAGRQPQEHPGEPETLVRGRRLQRGYARARLVAPTDRKGTAPGGTVGRRALAHRRGRSRQNRRERRPGTKSDGHRFGHQHARCRAGASG